MRYVTSGLVFAAAVMLSSSAGAQKTTTVSLDTYCDMLTFTINKDTNTKKKTVAAMSESASTCTADIMEGYVVTIKGYTNAWVSVGGPRFDGGTDSWGFLMQYPFKTGNSWGLYESTDGVNVALVASGTYTVSGSGPRSGPPAGRGAANPLRGYHGQVPLTLR